MIAGAEPSRAVQRRPVEYDAEVRFGVVMYGGVSLAMYINGVANELYEMACATPRREPADGCAGTREVYRRLSWLLHNPALRARYAARIDARDDGRGAEGAPPGHSAWDDALLTDLNVGNRVKLVVDVIAGTSAGGINGIFLAKALANGEPFAPLKDLWIDEGDIALLLNDGRSWQGLRKYRQPGPPRGLLNGDRMFRKLFEAVEGMAPKSAAGAAEKAGAMAGPEADQSVVDEIDLVVTTTDIKGSPVALRLTDDVVYERRHKRSFQFSYSLDANGRNDFVASNNGLLAFAARCTSSFPFAFEPMTLASARRLLDDAQYEKVRTAGFFSHLPSEQLANHDHLWRAYGDGGYLDNKPFSYAANLLAIRQAYVPVERKLLYIEPAPQLIDPHEGDVGERAAMTGAPGAPNPADQVPDALTNSLAALTTIPRYETIREDLQAVLKRNHTIERVDRIVREGEIDLQDTLHEESNPYVRILRDKQGMVPPFPNFERDDMVKYYGTAFLAYRRVRVSSVSDKLAERLGELWDTESESDQHYALTAMVREWRDQHYREDTENGAYETINRFLEKFDIGYRIRRLSFLLRQADHLIQVLRSVLQQAIVEPAYRLTEAQLSNWAVSDARSVRRLHAEGLHLLDGSQDTRALRRALAALKTLKVGLNNVQKAWRKRDRMLIDGGADATLAIPPLDPDLVKSLHRVLSLLLGGEAEQPIELRTRSGGSIPVSISHETQVACSCARTMQESVLIRVRAINQDARRGEPTLLQEALEQSIAAMVARIDAPLTWELLGRPMLTLPRTPAKQAAPSQPRFRLKTQIDPSGNMVMDTGEGRVIRLLIGEYYVYFDLFDQMSFPLYHETGIGEPATVEVARISPRDAPTLVDEIAGKRNKLAGTALGHFGGFIDARWRRNDIMWGRLDGAERLIKTLLPMSDATTQTVRRELVRQAQLEILKETFLPDGRRELSGALIRDCLHQAGTVSTLKRLRERMQHELSHRSPQYQRLLEIMGSLVDEKSLVDYVRNRDVDRKTDPQAALRNASRAVTITGRMLENITRQRGGNPFVLRWLARSGLLLQGMIAVSLPGSLLAHLWTHTAKMLYLFEVVWLMFALLLGSSSAQGLAVSALILTVVAHSLILLFGDIMSSRTGRLRLWWILPAFFCLLLAGVGVVALYNFPWCESLNLKQTGDKGCASTLMAPVFRLAGHT